MFVAHDTQTDDAVVGSELSNHSQRSQSDSGGRYRCLVCGSALRYQRVPDCSPFDYFSHTTTTDCVNDGNMSGHHRLGQELVTKTIVNWLPQPVEEITVDFESRIGSPSRFVISDIRMAAPIKLGVEIFYSASRLSLRRRLLTLFDEGYSVMLIFLTTGRLSAARVERHLQPQGIARIGRVNPDSLDVTLGSIISPDTLDPSTLESVPAYIA